MELYPTSFINKYIALSKQPTGNDFTPRQGFYLIIDYKTNTGSNGKKYTTALALYSDTATFNQVLLVSVYLHQLKNIVSKGPKSLSFDMLVNNIIQIEEVNRLNVNYTSYQIIWDFIGGGEEVINHFRLVEKQQYRILEEMGFDDWLNEELEQLYIDQLVLEEATLTHEHDLIQDELNAKLENHEDGFISDDADMNSQNEEGHSEVGNEDISDSNI